MTAGHGTADELRDIAEREATTDPQAAPIAELVELALLYVEPAHREDDAIALLETAVTRDAPEGERAEAAIWLAYLLLHFGMDEPSLARAEAVLQPLTAGADPAHSSAANMLLAEVGEERGVELSQRIRLLEASVEQQPGWVNNRHDLAVAYAAAGRQSDVTKQLEAALTNVVPADEGWTLAQREFEASITGRTASGADERLREAMRDLR